MGQESDIQSDIMTLLATHPKVAWAHVTTSGKVKGRGGHWMTLGYEGMADIIGQLRDGRLLAIEVKRPGEVPTDIQAEFMSLVNNNRGLAGWCDSVDGAVDLLKAA